MSQLIYDLDLSSLMDLLAEWSEPAYRAKQVWQGLYQPLYGSAEQFTNLPKPLRERLTEHFTFSNFKVKTYLDSSDGFTRKTLFELPDGHRGRTQDLVADAVTVADDSNHHTVLVR